MQKGRQKNKVMLLSERYVSLLLIRLFESSVVKLNDLLDIVTSFRTLEALTDRMVDEGMITKILESKSYKTTVLELTPKGRSVAEKLKEAQNIFQSP